MPFSESLSTESIIKETLSVEKNKRKQIEATATPQTSLRVGDIQKKYPGLPGGVKLAMAKAGFTDEQIERLYPQATIAVTREEAKEKPKKSWFDRNIEDKLKTGLRYAVPVLQYPNDIIQTAAAQIFDTDDSVAGWNISTDLGTLIANDKEAGSGWIMGGKARELQAERARKVRGLIGTHAYTVGRGKANLIFKPDTLPFNIMSGAIDAAIALTIPVAPGAKGIKKLAEALEQADRGGVVAKGIVEGTERIGRGAATIKPSKLDIDEIETARKAILVGDEVNFKEANRWFNTPQARRLLERTAESKDFRNVWDMWGRKVQPDLILKMVDETDPDKLRGLLLDQLGQAEGLIKARDLKGGNRFYQSIARRDKFISQIELPKKYVSRAFANVPQRHFDLTNAVTPRDQIVHLDTIDRMMKLSLVDSDTQTEMLSRAARLIVEKGPKDIEDFTTDFDLVMRRASTKPKVVGETVVKAKEITNPRNPTSKQFKVGQRVRTASGKYAYIKDVSKTSDEISLELVDERVHGDLVDAFFDQRKKIVEESKKRAIDDEGYFEDFGFFNKVNGLDLAANDTTFVGPGLVSELASSVYYIPDVRQLRRLTASKPVNWIFAKQGKLGDPNLQRLAEAGQLRAPFSYIDYVSNELWRPLITLTIGNHVRNVLDSTFSIALSSRKVSNVARHPFYWLSILRKETLNVDVMGRGFDDVVAANIASEAQEAHKFSTTKLLNQRYKDPVEKFRVAERLGVWAQADRLTDEVSSVVLGHGDELGKLNADWAARSLAGGKTIDEVYDLVKSGDEGAVGWLEDMKNLYGGKRNEPGRETFNRTTGEWKRQSVDLDDDNNLRLLIEEHSDRLLRATGEGNQDLMDVVAAQGGLMSRERTININSITSGEAKVGQRIEYKTPSGRMAMGEVSGLGTAPGEVFVRPYAFVDGESTTDLRNLLQSDNIYKDPKMPRKFMYEVRDPKGPEAARMKESFDRFVNGFHSHLYNKPLAVLERSPLFRQLYYDWVYELADSLDEASVQRIIANIRNSAASDPRGKMKPERLVGERTWERLLDLESGKRKAYGTINDRELNAFAAGKAIDDQQEMLYNAVDRSNFVDVLRIISPFMAQWQEFIGRMGRLAFTPTNLGPIKYLPDVNVMRRTSLIVEGSTQADPDGNGRGVIYKDPATGQMLFTIPFSGAVTKFFTGVESPLNVRVKGMAMGFDMNPGLGPVATIAVSQYLPDKPSMNLVREYLLPFGERKLEVGTFLPGWASKVVDGLSGNEGNVMFMNVYTETMQALAVSGKYDPSNDEDRERLMSDAKRKAQVLFFLRGLSQFTGPAAGTYDQVIKVKALKGEVDVYASQMSSVFREMRENEPDTAVFQFIEIFGEDAFVYMGNKTKALYGGLDASKKFGDFEREYASLFNAHKETAGYFGPVDTEFDFSVYLRQLETGKRVSLTPEETLAAAESTIALSFYKNMRDKFPKSMDAEQREYMAQYRKALQKRFKGYAQMTFDPGKTKRQIEDLFNAADKSVLDGNPVAEGVRYYNELRKKVLIEARNRGREGLGADDVEDLRVYLSEYADAITAQYPEFARVYDRLLSKELEQ
jgi:hypothetical protein